MIPELHKILYGEVDYAPRSGGRRVSGIGEPPAKFTAGRLSDRVTACLLSLEAATVSEIAAAIDTSNGKTRSTLEKLISTGAVKAIQIEGCATEYALSQRQG